MTIRRDDGRGAPRSVAAWRPLLLAAIAMTVGSAIAGHALLAEQASKPRSGGGIAPARLSLGAQQGAGAEAAAAVPAGAVAVVDGRSIPAVSYERLLAALAADSAAPLTPEDRRYVLDRLIDEELLLARALALDLPRRDRRIRAQLVQAMMAAALAAEPAPEPATGELRRYFDTHRELFTGPERVRVRHLHVAAEPVRTSAQAAERANVALERLRAGEGFEVVRRESGDDALVAVPDALLTPAKLREYVGPTAARTAFATPVGEIAGPVRSASGYEVLLVVERAAPAPLSFADAEDLVRSQWRREQEERALRRYLDRLRREARIVVRDDLAGGESFAGASPGGERRSDTSLGAAP